MRIASGVMLPREFLDVRDFLREPAGIQAQSYVQPDRIGVIGWSRRGGVVLMLVHTNNTRVSEEAPRASFLGGGRLLPRPMQQQRTTHGCDG
jgi:dienelactone hydrolase